MSVQESAVVRPFKIHIERKLPVLNLTVSTWIALFCLGLILVLGVLAPWVAPHHPTHINLELKFLPPAFDYPLGADHLGRCILSRILFGIRVSIGYALLTLGLMISLGFLVGATSGFCGGWVDRLLSGLMDILLAFPGLILSLAVVGVLGPSLFNAVIAVGLVGWVNYARIIRGLVLSLKHKDFVAAARASGTPGWRILFYHIAPHLVPPVLILGTVDMGHIILKIAGLSFLGLGAQPPTPEWGAMLNDGRPFMQAQLLSMFWPGLAILITVLSFTTLGEKLRDHLDPRSMP